MPPYRFFVQPESYICDQICQKGSYTSNSMTINVTIAVTVSVIMKVNVNVIVATALVDNEFDSGPTNICKCIITFHSSDVAKGGTCMHIYYQLPHILTL